MGLTKSEAEKLGIGHLFPQIKKAKPSKYHAKRTEYNGIMYASKAEAAYAAELDEGVRDGSVRWWIGQVKFRLGCPENVYVTDFVVAKNNQIVGHAGGLFICAVDVKGHATAKFKRDMKLWARYGPFPLYIIKNGRHVETIVGKE